MDIHKLYVSKYDPKLFKRFVSTSTRGVYGEVEVALTFYISRTGKTVLGGLKVYNGHQVIAKCSVRRAVRSNSHLDDTIRKVSKNLLEITGFSEVPYCTLNQTDCRQARALVKNIIHQLTEISPELISIETTHDWRLA